LTVHVANPVIQRGPATEEQNAWSLEVGAFSAGFFDGTRGLKGLQLQTFNDLELHELPFTYNATSWALMLRFQATSTVPAGGYVVLRAPEPFCFPAALCRGENATGYPIPAGAPTFVPALPRQPLQPLRRASEAAVPAGTEALMPAVPSRTACSVGDGGRQLEIAVLEGAVPAGLYELRFVVAFDPKWEETLVTNSAESRFAPMHWLLESWWPAADTVCSGACCPERRKNFQVIVGITELELRDRGVVEAYPQGKFQHRRVVQNDYAGWSFSNENPESAIAGSWR